MLTTQDTAKLLGVSSKRVRELIKSDRLSATQNPRTFKWEVQLRDLKKYINKGAKQKGAARNVDKN